MLKDLPRAYGTLVDRTRKIVMDAAIERLVDESPPDPAHAAVRGVPFFHWTGQDQREADRIGVAVEDLRGALHLVALLAKTRGLDLEVLLSAYGWTLSVDGEVHGLVAGDMGYDPTGIVIPVDHLDGWDSLPETIARSVKPIGYGRSPV